MNNYNIVALPPTLVEVLWDKIVPHLKKAIEISNGELTEEGIKRVLLSGSNMALLICRNEHIVAVHTLEVRELSEGLRVLHINAIGGEEMGTWFEQYVLVMRAIAKDLNCTEVRGCAVRNGWLRYLKGLGFEKISSTVRLKLGE